MLARWTFCPVCQLGNSALSDMLTKEMWWTGENKNTLRGYKEKQTPWYLTSSLASVKMAELKVRNPLSGFGLRLETVSGGVT